MTDTPITPEAVEHFMATALEGRAMTDSTMRIWVTDRDEVWFSDDPTESRDGRVSEYHRADLSADLVRAALERAAEFTTVNQVGINPRTGYVVGPALLGGTQGTHAGMAYADAIRAIATDPEAVASIVASVMGDKG